MTFRSFACRKTFQMQFDEHLRDISYGFNRHVASRGSSAIAELLVDIILPSCVAKWGGSVAEWFACWTQEQKSLGSNRSRDAVR